MNKNWITERLESIKKDIREQTEEVCESETTTGELEPVMERTMRILQALGMTNLSIQGVISVLEASQQAYYWWLDDKGIGDILASPDNAPSSTIIHDDGPEPEDFVTE